MRAPRPAMTFLQQAELIESLLRTAGRIAEGKASFAFCEWDWPQIEDLQLTASRLRLLAPHEDAIRRLVRGR